MGRWLAEARVAVKVALLSQSALRRYNFVIPPGRIPRRGQTLRRALRTDFYKCRFTNGTREKKIFTMQFFAKFPV
jgi:hypothetical protein